MSGELEKLKQHRKDLLLAEVGAWLHDMGKCTDEFIQHAEARGFQSKKSKAKTPGWLNPHKAVFAPSELSQFTFSEERRPEREEEAGSSFALHLLLGEPILSALDQTVRFFGHQYTLRELIYFGRPGMVGRTKDALKKEGLPADYLGRSHGAAHVEKEKGEDQKRKASNNAWRSTAFGAEARLEPGLTETLKGVPFSGMTDRAGFQRQVSTAFPKALGDTRPPENEVTLWDWSSTVAALYKAALAGALLGYKPKPDDLHWRLLSVRVDSAAFLERIVGIPDLLARRVMLRRAFERVRNLLEEVYPLATRVYQDQDGDIYVVPSLEHSLEFTGEQGRTLEELILTEFAGGQHIPDSELGLSGEVVCDIRLDATAWQAQRPDRTFDVPPIGSVLKTRPLTHADLRQVALWWQEEAAEICPVCQLRPKAESAEVCAHCRKRREPRVQEWLSGGYYTIWIDEVSDQHGRVALLVGQFALDDWLSGDLVQTLLVKAEEKNPQGCQLKNPSPARLRRVWETTKQFWKEVRDGKIPDIVSKCQRLAFTAEFHPKQLSSHLAYELNLGGYRLPIFYRGGRQFLTIERLDYVLKQLNLGSVAKLKDKLGGEMLDLELPGEYAARRQKIGTLRNIKEVRESDYFPHIPILAEPRTFMALVPADRAVHIAQAIKTKYEREMGKVRNRLPLHLGLVFFPRKLPLRAVLEAGRGMLAGLSEQQQTWKVQEVCEFHDHLPEWLKDDPHFRGGRTIALESEGHRALWHVPLTMGDGQTKDNWYPYVFIEGDEDQLADRRRRFKGCRPIGDDKTEPCWLVHAEELRQGDKVHFTPSYFDFEFLDTNARRFDVSYTYGRRRSPTKRNRPYLLEDLQRFEDLWSLLKNGLSTAQVKQLDGLIEAKREEWEQGTGNKEYCKTFEQFVCDTLKNAGWKKSAKPKDNEMNALHHAALTGELHDVLELYMEILKRKPEQDKREV